MKAEVKELNGVKVFKPMVERVWFANGNDFKDLFDNMLDESEGQKVIINMEVMDSTDSAGFGVILDTYKRSIDKNVKIVLCSLQPNIDKLFENTKVNKFIKIYKDESEAMSRI